MVVDRALCSHARPPGQTLETMTKRIFKIMIYLNSSSIRAVGWSDNHLFVLFHTSDEIYDHPGVPYAVYAGLMRASSKGWYYNTHIRECYR